MPLLTWPTYAEVFVACAESVKEPSAEVLGGGSAIYVDSKDNRVEIGFVQRGVMDGF